MSMQTTARKESPRSKRSVILAAAIDNFGREGFEHTKWATIADDVGIGQTALYHYFESKAHCLLNIMTLELDRSLNQFGTAVEGVSDHVERMRAAVASAYDLTDREALSARILVSHMDLLATQRPSQREEDERQRARALVRRIEDSWTTLIEDGIDAGAFVARDARMTGLAVLGQVIGVWRWYRPGGTRTLAEVSDFTSAACVRLVGESPTPEKNTTAPTN